MSTGHERCNSKSCAHEASNDSTCSTMPASTSNVDTSSAPTSVSTSVPHVNRVRPSRFAGSISEDKRDNYSQSIIVNDKDTINSTNSSFKNDNVHSLSYKSTCISTSPSLHYLFSPSSHLPPSDIPSESNFTGVSTTTTTTAATAATTTRRSRRSASTTGIRSRISLDEDSVRALVEAEEQRLRSRREQAFADQRKDWTIPSLHTGSSYSGLSSHTVQSLNKERDTSARRSITRQSYSVTGSMGSSGGGGGGGGASSSSAGGAGAAAAALASSTSVFIGPFASDSISAANTPGTEDSEHLTFTRNLHTAQSHHHHSHHHHMPHSQGSSREGRSSSSSLGMGAIPNGIIRTSNGWLQRKIHLRPQLRGIHLITDELMKQLPELTDFLVGMCHIQVMHTSASLALNEVTDDFLT